MSHLCIAEQTVGQVEQTKRGVRPLFLLHITGGSVAMARCHGLPQASRLFLMWQGHRELEFGRRQQTRTIALPHLCAHRHISNVSHQDEKGKRHWSEWLTKMKKLCQDQLPLEQYRDDVCRAVRQALSGLTLFKRKVLLWVKAQRCSNYDMCFNILGRSKWKIFLCSALVWCINLFLDI